MKRMDSLETPRQGMTLREVPDGERPRERMLRHGPQALSNAELLAVLLRTGTVRESAVLLAQRLLKQAGGVARTGRHDD